MELGRRAGFCTARPHLARRGHRCRLAHADLVLRVAVCGLHRRRGVFSPGVPERSQSQGPTCSLTPRSHRCGSPGQRGFRNLVNLGYVAPEFAGARSLNYSSWDYASRSRLMVISMWGTGVHAILRPLKEVTAAVARALGETSIWEISSGAAQGGGWRIGNTPWERRSTGGGGTRNRHAARDTERCRER